MGRALLPPCVPPRAVGVLTRATCLHTCPPRSVVHVVDRALLPYYRTVLDFTATRTDLNIFVQAIVSEGTYASVVTGETPFNGTIFVPNDR